MAEHAKPPRVKRCAGLVITCGQPAAWKVSWKEPHRRWRRRAKLCDRCLASARVSASHHNVVATPLTHRGRAPQ